MTDLINSEIDRFFAEKAQETARRGGLIFALDACGWLGRDVFDAIQNPGREASDSMSAWPL